MFTKRHLIITAAVTAVVCCLSTSLYFMEFSDGGDGVMGRAKRLIMDNYVDPLTDEQVTNMEDAAIAAMVASLGDPYSGYLNEKGLSDYEEDSKEDYVGIGVTVSFDAEKGVMTVVTPNDHSPAQKAGLLPGDEILAVDGIEITRETYNEAIDYIRGEGAKEGDSIFLTVRRGEAEPMEVEVIRETVVVETISYQMYEEGIAYLRISEFKMNSKDDFKNALETLKGEGMKGLIIDLRNNPGGYAQSVLEMTDMLIPEGTIAYLEDNKGRREYFNSDENELGLPMVILINGGTASAAELMAGSVQAYGLATVVGEKSFGKAVGQSPIPLTNDTAIYLTNARYYTPKGECIDKKGIEPDIPVTLSEEQAAKLFLRTADNKPQLTREEDTQLSRGIEVLKEKIGQ